MKLPGLKAAREAARITQAELAAKAKITAQTVSNLERGGTAAWRTANKLARALGVPVDTIEREAKAA